MADIVPVLPQTPTVVHRFLTMLLPQFIAYSRKGMVWFSSLGGIAVVEYCKIAGGTLGWTPEQILQWNGRMMLLQGILVAVGKFWTQQIADEDKALKTGLPPPAPAQNVAGGNITVEAPPAIPAQPAPPVHGLPPPRGKGE